MTRSWPEPPLSVAFPPVPPMIKIVASRFLEQDARAVADEHIVGAADHDQQPPASSHTNTSSKE